MDDEERDEWEKRFRAAHDSDRRRKEKTSLIGWIIYYLLAYFVAVVASRIFGG